MSAASVRPVSWARPAPLTVAPPSWIRGRRPAPVRVPSASPPPPAPVSAVPPRPVTIAPRPRTSYPSDAVARSGFGAMPTSREVELDAEIVALRGEVARLADLLASVRAQLLEDAEPEVVRLAVAVAERVVGRELAADPALVGAWAMEAIAALPDRTGLVVAVSPDVSDLLGEREGAAERTVARAPIVVDPALAPGSCELRSGATTAAVDAAARLASVRDALGLDGER